MVRVTQDYEIYLVSGHFGYEEGWTLIAGS